MGNHDANLTRIQFDDTAGWICAEGLNELADSDMLEDVAKDVEADGIAHIAEGSAELATSDLLDGLANSFDDEDM